MSTVIYKYRLDAFANGAVQTVAIHSGATILDTAFQDDQLVVWARVSPHAQLASYKFCVMYTGDEMADDVHGWQHIRSLQYDGLVFHVFVAVTYAIRMTASTDPT